MAEEEVIYQTRKVNKYTSATVTTSSVVIAPANPARRGIIIYNNSGNSRYLTFGPTASSATCTMIIPTFAHIMMLGPVVYTGPISAIGNAGTGNFTITELE